MPGYVIQIFLENMVKLFGISIDPELDLTR